MVGTRENMRDTLVMGWWRWRWMDKGLSKGGVGGQKRNQTKEFFMG
jgi:hypothetical protein